jgi:hypothetical protein
VAQAKPTIGTKADTKCLVEAAKTLQPGFNPADYAFHGGTEDNNVFTGTAGFDVFCGFGGNDYIGLTVNLDEGDIFLGGAGNDQVPNLNYGTFYGGEGTDVVGYNHTGGTFIGEGGDDDVIHDYSGTFVD